MADFAHFDSSEVLAASQCGAQRQQAPAIKNSDWRNKNLDAHGKIAHSDYSRKPFIGRHACRQIAGIQGQLMVYIITWSLVLAASASAVAALIWAVHSGQFERIEQGASSIFDGPESEREEADRFPDAPKA